MGEATGEILKACNYTYFKPETPEEAYENVKNSWELSLREKLPVSVLLEISYW